eukprot:9181630-Alexandrium_andersonii.AAC.1
MDLEKAKRGVLRHTTPPEVGGAPLGGRQHHERVGGVPGHWGKDNDADDPIDLGIGKRRGRAAEAEDPAAREELPRRGAVQPQQLQPNGRGGVRGAASVR